MHLAQTPDRLAKIVLHRAPGCQFVHPPRQFEIQVAETIPGMGGQRHIHHVVNIRPFRMVVQLFRLQGRAGRLAAPVRAGRSVDLRCA